MKKKQIYFTIGIVITVLFLLLKVKIYESAFTAPGFSNYMYNLGLYNTVALVTALTAWAGAGIYYYVINSVKFDRWYHWLCVLAITSLTAPVICYVINERVFSSHEIYYVAESLNFEAINVIYTAILFIVASFSIRWWSSNCRHTPIPQ